MHQVEHLVVVRPGVLLDAVQLQRLRGAATALVERSDEALSGPDLVQHVVVHITDCSQCAPSRPLGGRDW
jgi:hypothetical protein